MPADERAAVVLALVQKLLAEVHPHARGQVTLDSRFDDLGIGSLELAELLLRVQKAFAVELPVDILRSAETPRDLVRALDRGRALPVEGLRAEPPPATMAAPEAPAAATTLTGTPS